MHVREGWNRCATYLSDKSDIEASWIRINGYRHLIGAEFAIRAALQPVTYTYLLVLNDDEQIPLWQLAYERWKPFIEPEIRKLCPDYESPDFTAIIHARISQRQKEINILLNNSGPLRRSNCSDGEAEFWNAARGGNLDAMGF